MNQGQPATRKDSHSSSLDLLRASRGPTCADLTNHGTHFTVDIDVGTPAQKFSVVADTGSNSLIIPSCICQKRKYCSMSDRCFTGTNRSTSFSLKEGPRGLQSVFVTFGSGTIEAIVAREKVTIGHLTTDMKGGILLMVARNLNIAGKFEGILGLGLPARMAQEKHKKHHAHTARPKTSAQVKDLVSKIINGIFGGPTPETFSDQGDHLVPTESTEDIGGDSLAFPSQARRVQLSTDVAEKLDDIGDIAFQDQNANFGFGGLRLGTPAQLHGSPSKLRLGSHAGVNPGFSQHGAPGFTPGLSQHGAMDSDRQEEDSDELGPKGLLEQAGIDRFSMCFNDGASGVLKLNTPKMENSLGSVGKFHWGLDFRGISIGNSSVPLRICSATNMTHGQETPCGAIPDSGTTVIMAPKEHLSTLLESICDEWDRCSKNYTALLRAGEAAKQAAAKEYSWDPFEIAPVAKSAVLQLLLMDCASWLDESKGLSELPSLKFHVAGAGGNQKTLELPGWAYVLESTRIDAAANKKLQGVDEDVALLEEENRTATPSKVCSPAFSTMDYNTQKNGPVWILGTPFFYEFNVGYDLSSSPPSISFTSTQESPCVNCGQHASLLDSASADSRRPRWTVGPWRIPDIDMDLPL